MNLHYQKKYRMRNKLLLTIALLGSWLSLSARIEIIKTTPATGGNCNGTITLVAEGDPGVLRSAGPYKVMVTGDNGYSQEFTEVEGTQEISSLCGGNYTIKVTYYGCEKELNAKVASYDFSLNSDDCPVFHFMDESTPPTGQTITAWQWDFGDGMTSTQQNPDHTYTKRDENYTVKLTLTVSGEAIPVTKNIYIQNCSMNCADSDLSVRLKNTKNASTFSTQDGEIIIEVTGGTAPYTYLWSNGSTTMNLTGVGAGTYNVTVTDNVDCETMLNASISACPQFIGEGIPDGYFLSGNLDYDKPTRPRGSDASLYIDIQTNDQYTQPSAYYYEVTGPNNFNKKGTSNGDFSVSGLMAGTYTVKITDGCGNEFNQSIFICDKIELGQIFTEGSCLSVKKENPVCVGTGYIGGQLYGGEPTPISVTGGFPDPEIKYLFFWKHESDDKYSYFPISQPQGYNPEACAGVTSIFAIDQYGCESNITEVTLNDWNQGTAAPYLSEIIVVPTNIPAPLTDCREGYQSALYGKLVTYCASDFGLSIGRPFSSAHRILDVDYVPIYVRDPVRDGSCNPQFYYKDRYGKEVNVTGQVSITGKRQCRKQTDCGEIIWCAIDVYGEGREGTIYYFEKDLSNTTPKYRIEVTYTNPRQYLCVEDRYCGNKIVSTTTTPAPKLRDET